VLNNRSCIEDCSVGSRLSTSTVKHNTTEIGAFADSPNLQVEVPRPAGRSRQASRLQTASPQALRGSLGIHPVPALTASALQHS
jgi:hypothetical protein